MDNYLINFQDLISSTLISNAARFIKKKSKFSKINKIQKQLKKIIKKRFNFFKVRCLAPIVVYILPCSGALF